AGSPSSCSDPVHTTIPLLHIFLSCSLQRCHLTGACCGDLTTVLRTNQSLTELELGANVGLGDSGVQQLCEGLKHSNCKLQRLDLWDCGLMDAGCMDLAAVLRTSQSLTELKLSHNKLGDAGVKLLCEGLKQNCKLQSLSLRWCNITNAGCGDLADVLRINQYLTKLMLGYNKDLGDSGVRLLCEGLKDPNCKLQMLELHGCHLSTACCEDLSAALTTSQTLTYLDLAANRVEDSGVWLLCEGLKHPNCKLQRLRLGRCDLTDAGCGDLSAVLRANQSLTELELSYNKLGDAVVQLLCEILKHPNCKLQRLGLAGCYLTDAASADLATVLRTSQSLTELDLSGNNPGDAGVQLLCEALKHPNCKLQRLGLRSCHLTDTDCGDLAAVLSTNQSLIELDLSGNNPGDAGVRLLCEALKHPNCKLQRLEAICKEQGTLCQGLSVSHKPNFLFSYYTNFISG
uniref:Uncharacterized protein n=1 Tax=Chelydra serpentina TaxID=8475 RepID=A0A8C3SCQ0_CHESE